MNIFIRCIGEICWYCWGLIVLALLEFQPINNLLASHIGYETFSYAMYVMPILIMWLSILFHLIGLGSIVSIVLMNIYLVYNGVNILMEAWEFFRPILLSYDHRHIWHAVSNQVMDDVVYFGSGILSLLAVIGGLVYLHKNKDSFVFDMKARKAKAKNKNKRKDPFGSAALATPKEIKEFTADKGLAIGFMPDSPVDTKDLKKAIENYWGITRRESSNMCFEIPKY